MEKEKTKTQFIYFRESAFQSVVSDIFLFGSIMATCYFNHKFLSGKLGIDILLIALMIFMAANRTSGRTQTFTRIEDLKRFVDTIEK